MLSNLFRIMVGGEGNNLEGDDQVDSDILRDDIIDRVSKTDSTLSLNVPLEPTEMPETEYMLSTIGMVPLIQAWLLNRYKGHVCPFYELIYRTFADPRTGDYVDVAAPNQNLHDVLRNIKACNKRFVVISLHIENEESGHQNVLIIDQKLKSVERYEPHHTDEYDRDTWYSAEGLDDACAQFFHKYLDLTYFSPLDYCVRIPGLQTEFDYSEKGWCVLFAFLYTETRLKYPDIDRRSLVKLLYTKLRNLQKQNKLRNYLDGYVKVIQEFTFEIMARNLEKLGSERNMDAMAERVRRRGMREQVRWKLPKTIVPKDEDRVPTAIVKPVSPAPVVPISQRVRRPRKPTPSDPNIVPHSRELVKLVTDISNEGLAIISGKRDMDDDEKFIATSLLQKILFKEQNLTWQDLDDLVDIVLLARFPKDVASFFVMSLKQIYPDFIRNKLGDDACISKLLFYATADN